MEQLPCDPPWICDQWPLLKKWKTHETPQLQQPCRLPITSKIISLAWPMGKYPLVICYIAIENGHRNTVVDFPIENGGSFHSYVSLPEGKTSSANPGLLKFKVRHFSNCSSCAYPILFAKAVAKKVGKSENMDERQVHLRPKRLAPCSNFA